MKTALALIVMMIPAACISSTEFDKDQAYSQCSSIPEPSRRDRCIADAIQRAERERHEQTERDKELDEAAERRAIGREIAGAGQD